MKLAILLLSLALYANAQTPADKTSEPTNPTTATRVDPKLHADAVKLVELSGARQNLQDNVKTIVEKGRSEMMAQCKVCSPAFGDEWAKRMVARTKIDDYVAVFVRGYEKYFDDAEILELISLQNAKKTNPAAAPSPALKEKITSVMPKFMGEVMGQCAELGAKLGGEIGMEIEKEHPEYFTQPAAQ